MGVLSRFSFRRRRRSELVPVGELVVTAEALRGMGVSAEEAERLVSALRASLARGVAPGPGPVPRRGVYVPPWAAPLAPPSQVLRGVSEEPG